MIASSLPAQAVCFQVGEQREKFLLTRYGRHSIVGKGNHSPQHIQHIKPKVEELCQQLGLQYSTEANAGRMYINLQGGPANMPAHVGEGSNWGYSQGYGGKPGAGYGHQGGGQHHQGGGPQYQQGGSGGGGGGQDPNAELEAEVKKALPGVLRFLRRNCCTVM